MTITIAQQLYEKGYITYHRTDSVNLSQISLNIAKKYIEENYGKNYYNFRKYKSKGLSTFRAIIGGSLPLPDLFDWIGADWTGTPDTINLELIAKVARIAIDLSKVL